MQKAEENLQLELSAVEKKHNESLGALEKEREDLQQKFTLVETNLSQAHSQLATLETEAEGLRHRTKALEEGVDKLQSDAVEARAVIKERETEERRLCLMVEQLETDLGSSKNLTETLQVALGAKEKREVELLGEKEQAVTQVLNILNMFLIQIHAHFFSFIFHLFSFILLIVINYYFTKFCSFRL